jgi:hypothetical protein
LTWEKSVKNAKDRHWKEKLEEMKSSTVWTTIKRHTLTHTKALPEIEGSSDFQSKCGRLRYSLFPDNPISTLTIPDDFVVSKKDLSNDFTPVSKTEVKKALDNANTKSAVGCDMINYTILKHLDLANPSLLPNLVTALLQYGLHYYEWKHAICVVIPKQGKSDYILAKSYRPISLLSCIGKIIEKISSLGKICGAISSIQFGNKEGHSAIGALLRTLMNITPYLRPRAAWGNSVPMRPSLAAHDVQGAFNNTKPEILIKLMILRRMPKYLIEWVKDFTLNRKTFL